MREFPEMISNIISYDQIMITEHELYSTYTYIFGRFVSIPEKFCFDESEKLLIMDIIKAAKNIPWSKASFYGTPLAKVEVVQTQLGLLFFGHIGAGKNF